MAGRHPALRPALAGRRRSISPQGRRLCKCLNTSDDFVHRDGTNLHHAVGTCRMGDDSMAAVDLRLRVRGVGGLRVVDASVMPTVTTGNAKAPTIMIGEKGAAMIREDARAA